LVGRRLGIEYDGRDHLTPQRALRDLDRQARLTAAGWTVLRFGASDVLNRPWRVARSVRDHLR
jgi:very-short-patch-repair endonuclease